MKVLCIITVLLMSCENINDITQQKIQIEDKFIELPNTDQINLNLKASLFNSVGITISYSLSLKSNVNLSIRNSYGTKIVDLINGEIDAGEHSISFIADNNTYPDGLYYYVITVSNSENIIKITKILVIKASK